MSEKLSFKVPRNERQLEIEIELNENETIELVCSFPSVEASKDESTVYEMFKSIIRYTKDKDEVLKQIEKNLDSNQLLEIISFIMENLILKKN